MLGHDDVSVNDETVLTARFFQDLQEAIAGFGCAQEGLTAVTTGSDEMQIVGAIIAMESLGHPVRIISGFECDCDPHTVGW